MRDLIIFSFNQTNSGQEIAAKTHLTPKQQIEIYHDFSIDPDIQFVLLSTCYRSDILIWSQKPKLALIEIFSQKIPNFSLNREKCQIFKDKEAFFYLLKVYLGLLSNLICETEISSQIKNAFNLSRANNRTQKELADVFLNIQKQGKAIKQKFNLSAGSLSHAYLAFQNAWQNISNDSLILVCGFGQINKKILKYFKKKKSKPQKIILFTKHKLPEAKKFIKKEEIKNIKIESYSKLRNYLAKANCVFLATNTRRPILQDNYLDIINSRSKKLNIFDLSMPSDCETKIKKSRQVNYFDINFLDKKAKKNQILKERKKKETLKYIEQNNQETITKAQTNLKAR